MSTDTQRALVIMHTTRLISQIWYQDIHGNTNNTRLLQGFRDAVRSVCPHDWMPLMPQGRKACRICHINKYD